MGEVTSQHSPSACQVSRCYPLSASCQLLTGHTCQWDSPPIAELSGLAASCSTAKSSLTEDFEPNDFEPDSPEVSKTAPTPPHATLFPRCLQTACPLPPLPLHGPLTWPVGPPGWWLVLPLQLPAAAPAASTSCRDSRCRPEPWPPVRQYSGRPRAVQQQVKGRSAVQLQVWAFQ